jgi:hypothetical protein
MYQGYGGGEAGFPKNLLKLKDSPKWRKSQEPSPSRLLICINLHLNKAHRADPSGSFIIAGGTSKAVQVKFKKYRHFERDSKRMILSTL